MAKSPKSWVGIVMRETKGTANPKLVNEIMMKEVKKL